MSLLQPGNYFGRLVKWGTGTSKEKGTPYIFLDFDVTHFAENNEWTDISSQSSVSPARRTINLYLSDNAWPFTKEKLERLGFNGSFDDESMDFGDEPKTKGVELYVKHDEYDGKTREKWDLTGGGGFEHTPPAKDVTRKYAAKWRAETGSKPTGKPAAPKAPSKPRQPEPAAAGVGAESGPSKDDIPF